MLCLSIFPNPLSRENVQATESEAVSISKNWELASIKKAVILFETTGLNWETLGEPQKAVFCFFESAKAAQTLADYQTAFRVLNKALKITVKYNLTAEQIVLLSYYSLLSQQTGDKEKTYRFSQKALLLSKTDNTKLSKSYALFSAGIYEYFYGRIDRAVEYFEQADSFARHTEDIFIISQILSYISFSHLREGTAYQASEKMDFVLALCEHNNYQKGIALAYLGKGYINYFLNEKQSSLDYFHKSLSLFPADFEWLEKARTVQAIGLIHKDFKENKSALFYFQQAADYFEKADYPLGRLTSLSFLAETYLADSQTDQARDIYKSAETIARETGDDFGLATVIEGIGTIDFKERKFDNAIRNYRNALKAYENTGVKLPVVENLIANAYYEKGDFISARKFYESALQTNDRYKDYLQLSENLFNLSKLEVTASQPEKALENIKRSVELTENLYTNVANSKLKSNYFSNVFERYELLIKLLMKNAKKTPNENFAFQSLQIAEKSRARTLLENLYLSEANFTKDADVESIKREKELRILLNSKADSLTDLLSQNTVKAEIDKLNSEINEIENELANIRTKLKQNSPIYSAIKNPAPFDIEDFQKNILDQDSLLLEFSFGNDESYLWLIGKNEFAAFVLPPREQIESKIQTLRELLASREMLENESIESYQERIKKAEKDFSTTAKLLSNELFGQVADRFENKRLIIVPDGKLGYFPVSALPLPNAETNDPILLSNEVVYEPSASTLSILAKNTKSTDPVSKSLLIFSDPVFTENDARFSSESQKNLNTQNEEPERFRFVESLNSLSRLSSSKTEADAIVGILGNSDADNFSGFAANRQNLLETNSADYKILHFATHGLIDETRPELSGIVLSRFDENGNKRDEFFRLHDIYGMNLNSDLVVLSACNTGIGKEVKGEGLMSLNNAFLSVGAKSVMASLWKVEDNATLELMKNFYGAMASENLTPSKALQKAQIKMWQSDRYKSPFYWAAFTVQGDYKNVPDISRGFGAWIYVLSAVMVLILAVAVFVVIRRRNYK